MIDLLRKLIPCLEPDGIILCRESTVQGETVTRTGNYSVVYRSVPDYTRIFTQCGLTLQHRERNEAYIFTQMGCELIEKWKRVVPEPFHALRLIGGLTYWGMRVGTHWITRLPQALGMSFPCLENHFFVLKARPPCS